MTLNSQVQGLEGNGKVIDLQDQQFITRPGPPFVSRSHHMGRSILQGNIGDEKNWWRLCVIKEKVHG